MCFKLHQPIVLNDFVSQLLKLKAYEAVDLFFVPSK